MKVDTPQEIQTCLSCKKAKCTNCMRYKCTGNYGRKPVIAFLEGEEDMFFDSPADAGDFFNAPADTIRNAIRKGHKSRGYYWRYA